MTIGPDHVLAIVIDRANTLLESWYGRSGTWMGSLVIALVLVFLVHAYVEGGSAPISHGAYYAALSLDPVDTGVANPFRGRILAPLLGWVSGLRGPWFVLVPWGFLVGFLAQVNVWCRRQGAAPLHALAIMLAISFSPVAMHSLAGPGFIDAVSYFFLAAALMNIDMTLATCTFMALAIMTHEATAVLLPAWLLAAGLGRNEARTWVKRAGIVALMLMPYLLYRWWAEQADPEVLSTAFYFSDRNRQSCLDVGLGATAVGAFAVFRLHWLIVPMAFIAGGWKNRHLRWSLLVAASVGSTLLIAFDTTRMLCWTFPVLALAGVDLARSIGRNTAVLLLLSAWLLNFLISPYTVTGGVPYRLNEIRAYVLE